MRFNYAFATFVNEANGSVLATSELAKTGTSAGQQLWSSLAGVNVPISASHIGVRIRLVGGTDPTAACGQLYTECYDLASGNGVVHIRGWSSATAPSVQNARGSSPAPARRTRTAAADLRAGVQAEVDLGATHPLTARA